MPAMLRTLSALFVSLFARRLSSSSVLPVAVSENFGRVCSDCLDFAFEEVDSEVVSEEDLDLKWDFISSGDCDDADLCSIIDLYLDSDELSPSSPPIDSSSLWDESTSSSSPAPFSSPHTSYFSGDLEVPCSFPVYNLPIFAPKPVNPALSTPTWLDNDFDSIPFSTQPTSEDESFNLYTSSPLLPEHLEIGILSLVATPEPLGHSAFATLDRSSLPAHLAVLPPRPIFTTFDRSSEVYTTPIVAPKPFNPATANPSWLHDDFDATSEVDSRASSPIPSNVHDTFDYFAPSPSPSPTFSFYSNSSVDTPELESDSCSDTTSGSFTCTPLPSTKFDTYEQPHTTYTTWSLDLRAPAPCYLDLLMDKYAHNPASPLPSNVHNTFDYFSPSPTSFFEWDERCPFAMRNF